MKKLALLFFLSIFLFNTVGYFIAFKAIQYGIKSEVKSTIQLGFAASDLSIITIKKNDFCEIEWLENGKEMRYKDELYDIIKSTETSTSIIFYCINDKKEKSLLSKLEEHINTHVASNKSTKDDSSKKIIDHVIKLYFSTDYSFPYIQVTSDAAFFNLKFSYSSAFIKTNSPPPEFI